MGAAELRCSFCHRAVPEESVAGAESQARCPCCGDRLVLEPRAGRPLLTAVGLIGTMAVITAVVVGVMLERPPHAETTPSEGGEAVSAGGSAGSAADSAVTPSVASAANQAVVAPSVAAAPVALAAPGAPAADGNTPKAEDGAWDLSYRWKEGEHYCYRISCQVGWGDSATEMTSTNTYTAAPAPDAAGAKPDPREASPGSGTAFVVSADGYLVTCAHVVRNASDIKVTLGGQTSPCEVVVRDDARDLAVLRIDRRNLPALALADSEKVELAQEVRVIGFPLSDILGSSLKVTQGSVAGIAVGRRGKVFQIDAVVNPGNSGGPLVDSSGCVVGVVSAQLVGTRVAEVGFAVPINYAKALLSQQKIGFQAGGGGPKLDGPALVKRVAPSVGLVTMMCHGGESDGQKRIVLNYHAIVERRAGQRAGLVAAPGTPEQRDDGKLVTGELGEIFQSDSRVRLPGLLGSLATVVIDPLPDGDQKTWMHEEIWTLTSSRSEGRGGFAGLGPGFFGPRPPFGPHRRGFPGMFGPFANEPEPTTYLAIRRATFTLEETQGTTARIRKRLDLRTLEKTGDKPTVELAADGQTLFDLKLGVPQKITLSGTLTIREGGSQSIPVALTCERTTAAAAASPVAPAGPAAPASASPPVPIEPPEKRLDRFLADLRAGERDWSKCFQALQGLSLMPVIESRREEVAEVLNAYLKEKNYSARSSALRAALTWGAPRNASVIAELIKSPSDRARAARALRTLGSAAESAVVALLADEDAEVRVEACKLLAEIGGPKSLAAIQQRLAQDADEQFQAAAQAAIHKLQARK